MERFDKALGICLSVFFAIIMQLVGMLSYWDIWS